MFVDDVLLFPALPCDDGVEEELLEGRELEVAFDASFVVVVESVGAVGSVGVELVDVWDVSCRVVGTFAVLSLAAYAELMAKADTGNPTTAARISMRRTSLLWRILGI
jgi:hypothetical protein